MGTHSGPRKDRTHFFGLLAERGVHSDKPVLESEYYEAMNSDSETDLEDHQPTRVLPRAYRDPIQDIDPVRHRHRRTALWGSVGLAAALASGLWAACTVVNVTNQTGKSPEVRQEAPTEPPGSVPDFDPPDIGLPEDEDPPPVEAPEPTATAGQEDPGTESPAASPSASPSGSAPSVSPSVRSAPVSPTPSGGSLPVLPPVSPSPAPTVTVTVPGPRVTVSVTVTATETVFRYRKWYRDRDRH